MSECSCATTLSSLILNPLFVCFAVILLLMFKLYVAHHKKSILDHLATQCHKDHLRTRQSNSLLLLNNLNSLFFAEMEIAHFDERNESKLYVEVYLYTRPLRNAEFLCNKPQVHHWGVCLYFPHITTGYVVDGGFHPKECHIFGFIFYVQIKKLERHQYMELISSSEHFILQKQFQYGKMETPKRLILPIKDIENTFKGNNKYFPFSTNCQSSTCFVIKN